MLFAVPLMGAMGVSPGLGSLAFEPDLISSGTAETSVVILSEPGDSSGGGAEISTLGADPEVARPGAFGPGFTGGMTGAADTAVVGTRC